MTDSGALRARLTALLDEYRDAVKTWALIELDFAVGEVDTDTLYQAEVAMLVARAAVDAAIGDLLEAAALLPELIDTGDCYYDHHGYCQAHALQPRPCPHERAKALVARPTVASPTDGE